MHTDLGQLDTKCCLKFELSSVWISAHSGFWESRIQTLTVQSRKFHVRTQRNLEGCQNASRNRWRQFRGLSCEASWEQTSLSDWWRSCWQRPWVCHRSGSWSSCPDPATFASWCSATCVWQRPKIVINTWGYFELRQLRVTNWIRTSGRLRYRNITCQNDIWLSRSII